ncbi:MAG: two-component system sensor histidine kinase CreC [Methylophilaceae bacterium]|jgi:two-component system sensor histidine kinase CreC|nr:two-component system sensor histidine kinase CreC [Methyloradius sp.]
MKISLKILLGYFLIVGLAAFFVLNVFVDEVKPGVRQAMEDTLVDSANLLAELATNDLKTGNIEHGDFSHALAQYQQRITGASIWGLKKSHPDYRVYITDQHGIVVFDSDHIGIGQDYSKWNDVYLTLQGKYGVRSSPAIPGDKNTQDTIMYIGAPIKDGKTIIGSLTVAKANRTMQPFIDRAQQKIVRWGLLLILLSSALGILFTWRFTRAIHRLRDYAIAVAKGQKVPAPTSSNDELAELAVAMQTMRQELDGKQYVQDSIHNLTHELKSPISAIQASADLINEDMPSSDKLRFLDNIKEQTQRLQQMIQNMLGLAELEYQQTLQHTSIVDLTELIKQQIHHLQAKANQRQIQFEYEGPDILKLEGEPFLLAQAITNLLDNALDFSPEQNVIHIALLLNKPWAQLTIQDHGAGIPDFALDKVFDKFYSLPHPASGKKSTGLGLNFVREVAHLHHGEIELQNHPAGGAIATLRLPAN